MLFKVESAGQRYDEMHVDGGVTSQLFLGVTGLDWRRIAEKLRVEGTPQLYLIRNSPLAPKWVPADFTLEPRELFVARVVEAEGILAEACTRVARTDSDLARIRPLAEMGAVSQQDLDSANARYEAAQRGDHPPDVQGTLRGTP